MGGEGTTDGASTRYHGTGRLEAFSDGVIAIAITLLVLELSIGEEVTALHRVLDAWPSYLAYLVSFATIGAAWLAHTSITDRLEKADLGLLRLNLLFLFAIAFIPFPTKLLAEELDVHQAADERVFVTLFGLTLLAVRVLLYALDAYARREAPFAVPDDRDDVRTGIGTVLVAYGVVLLIGLLTPFVAVLLYFLVAVVLIVPFHGMRGLLSGRRR